MRQPSGAKPRQLSARERAVKVLVVSSVYPTDAAPHFGVFVEQRVHHVAKHCDIRVVAPLPWFPFNRWIRGAWCSVAPRRAERRGIAVYRPRFLSLPRYGKCWDALLYYASVLPTVAALRREFPFDLVDVHFAYPDGVAGVLLAKTFGCPAVVTLRGDEARLMSFALRRPQIRHALRRARLISVSGSLRQVASGFGLHPEKIRVIPNGVDGAHFRPMDPVAARREIGLPHDRKILLAVGALIERKGHLRVLDVLPEIIRREPNVLYVAVGAGVRGEDYAGQVERSIREKQLQQHVRIVAPRPHTEVPVWMNAADVFCLATRWEGWCNALTEALACGLPVVTTRVGGNEEFVRDGEDGFLVPYWDGPSFIDAISRALASPWDRVAIATRARARSWEKVAEEVLEEFNAIAAERATGAAVAPHVAG
jgi:teichuronic acid biosynthesis glycosyltransferase TuaC